MEQLDLPMDLPPVPSAGDRCDEKAKVLVAKWSESWHVQIDPAAKRALRNSIASLIRRLS